MAWWWVARVPFSSVDELLDALRSQAGVPSFDVVPALPHLLQTADLLARDHPDDPELTAAGLVHDLASALDPASADHASDGARLIEPLLGVRVARLVAGHTDAKRYLVTVEAEYAGALSPNSRQTLIGQGGPMTDAERGSFEGRADWEGMVLLRRADDAAKVPGRVVADVDDWREMLEELAARQAF